jgi:hypothetical protein
MKNSFTMGIGHPVHNSLRNLKATIEPINAGVPLTRIQIFTHFIEKIGEVSPWDVGRQDRRGSIRTNSDPKSGLYRGVA